MTIKSDTWVIILGGGIKREDTGQWRTTEFNETDAFGALGDRLRVLAGSMRFHDNPQHHILVLGGKGQLKEVPEAPAVSEVIKHELLEMSIPEASIITETESNNTYEQMQKLKDFIGEQETREFLLISNRYHLPRIEAFIGQDEVLQKMFQDKKLHVEAAEDIVIEHDPTWKEKIEEIYKRKDIQERIEKELEGARQIREGSYKFR